MGKLTNKVLGAVLVVGGIVGWFFRHFIEAVFFDLVIKVLTPFVNPLLPSVTAAVSTGLEYGPPMLMGFLGLLFLYLGLRRRNKTSQITPTTIAGDSVHSSPYTAHPSTAANPAPPIAAIEMTTSTSVIKTPTSSTKITTTSAKIIFGERDKAQ